MICYTSHTGTRSTLASLRAHGWHLLLSATGRHSSHEGFPYALDNGAWTAHRKGAPFDFGRFVRHLDDYGDGARWCVVPDVVQGGFLSLSLSLLWLPYVAARTAKPLIAVQDGMRDVDLEPHVGPRVGLFVGGSTEWKEASCPMWGRLAHRTGCHLHVGRVNTRRRMLIAAQAGAHSIDGTSAIRFPKNIPKLTRWAKEVGDEASSMLRRC